MYSDVNTAISHVLTIASADDLIVVCGSVFVAGEVDTEKWKD
jgi:folylpolyglutamate synthase/dihydropteroate synthase